MTGQEVLRDAAESFAPCTVHTWCQVDHSKDDDAIDAQYHKRSRHGQIIEYDLVISEGRPYVYWQEDFAVSVDRGNEVYFDQLIVDLIDMKTAWIEFERDFRSESDHSPADHLVEPDKMIRRRPEVDEHLRELDA
ncbi:hypothetical protein [Microbacterium sp. A1-JK]|uniref:hypothetical protein n=1 Tax=Microbacterium sp. A1-JK TaxID=3177516 RepID=UPI00388718FE